MVTIAAVTVPVRVRIELTHMSPSAGGTTPCCGHTPFELRRADRMTNDAALVTCPGAWLVQR